MSSCKAFVVLCVALAFALVVPLTAGADTAPFVPGEILVQFKPGAAADAKADAHRQAGGAPQAEIARTGVQLVRVPAGQEHAFIALYEKNPNILFAEPNFIRSIPEPLSHGGPVVLPSDAYFDEEWGLDNWSQWFLCNPNCSYKGTQDADIDAPEAWAISTGSSSVTVAVIDTGIDSTHPDLAPNYACGYDFVNNDNNPADDHGHGTHVAGTIGAAMTAGKVVGVAPNARLLAYKVCNSGGSCPDSAIQQAIDRAITDGANVINMSLGGTAYSATTNSAVQSAWNAGLVIVAAAGNSGVTSLFYPAAYANVVSVAAFDEHHGRASFSNYGTWVDISAPGNVIMSSYPGGYAWMSGTSMATPHVAGAAALVWSPSVVGMSNAEVVGTLLQSADRVGVGSTRLDSWTMNGGLNLHAAMSGNPSNQAPIANAGLDQTVIDSNGNGSENVTLNGSASDADGTIASYAWSEGCTSIGSSAILTHLFAIGTHVVKLTVTDNVGDTDTDTVTITVQAGTDTVAITKAAYSSQTKKLTVEATSTGAPSAILTAYNNSNPLSPVSLGALVYNSAKNKYTATFSLPSKPTAVKVTSSLGGSATRTVSGK